ncbi:MAG: UvrD-helicase domain-containing protein, partial [Firmicutes bacterium]|nr:UvrD-helicase domain-containing protein [Bacillota bacterium]
MDILAELNPAQAEAVTHGEGPLLVLAGPGSGKTRVITHRIAYLINICGVRPHNIMAVTFTNKAANEMRERLERLVPGQVAGLTLGTFHAICARLLRREGTAIGLDSDFVIYDDSDQQTMVKRILKEMNLDDKMYRPSAIQAHISAAKSELRGPFEYAEYASSYLEEVISRVYRRYQELLAENRALDFDDLLMTTVRLFRERPELLEKYQSRYVQILVDEFQDTNRAQYVIVKQLAGKHRNICVVGDEDQSIYSWRG